MYKILMSFGYFFISLLNICQAEDFFSNAPHVAIRRFAHQDLILYENVNLPQYSTFDPGHLKSFLFHYHFPKNKKIHYCLKRPLLANDQMKYDFSINERNEIIVENQEALPFFCVSSRGFLPGESVEHIYESEDHSFHYKKKHVPNPIIIKDQDKKVLLKADLISVFPTIYQIQLPQLFENEEIVFETISGKEKLRQTIKYLSEGVTYSPDVESMKGGIAKISFKCSNVNPIIVYLPWGENFLEDLRGNRIYFPQKESRN